MQVRLRPDLSRAVRISAAFTGMTVPKHVDALLRPVLKAYLVKGKSK